MSGVGIRVADQIPEMYLWRCVGCGALFATPEKYRSVVPEYHGEHHNPCGHRIDPVGFEEDMQDD